MSSKDLLSFIIMTTRRALKMCSISVYGFILLISTALWLEVKYTNRDGWKDCVYPLKGDVWIQFHPLKLRNVFPSVKKTGQHGGVALIIPYVGNLSHIKLTPNFHTCGPMCWKSSNSLTHTHTYARV